MAQPNLTDATIEFLFSEQEVQVAKQLDQLHIMWYQTKYARLWKERNSIPVPTDAKDHATYFLALAEIDGQLSVYQSILDECKVALNEISVAKAAQEERARREGNDVAKRASELVDKPQT